MAGSTGTVSATVAPAGASNAMTWASDAPSIATVSGSGTSATVTAVAGGTATIRATSSANAAVSGTVTVTVTVPVIATLTLSSSAVTLVPGQPSTLTATAKDAAGVTITAAPITWTSTSAAVATVGTTGQVTGVSPGTTTITARSGSATATASVMVSDGGYIGVTGGTVTALGGTLVIEVPAGTVTTPTAFTVRTATSVPANTRLVAGTAVVIEPQASFTVAPRLRLAYPTVLAPDVVVTQLRLAQLVNNAWQEATWQPVDRTVRLVSANMTSTGTWAVFAPPPSLRGYSQVRGIEIGGALDTEMADADIRRLFATELNSITPGNWMKWSSLRPTSTSYTFANADNLVNFAEANGMRIHGHVLLWHSQAPAWIQAPTQTRTTMLAAMKEHVETVVGRYKGRLATWDVANEVIADNQTGLRSTFWVNIAGPDIIDSAFVWARRTDPAAKLYLNDYNVETVNPKSDSLLALASRLKARGVPIDGLGLQGHYVLPGPSMAQVKANLDRIAAAGFDIRITEIDVRLPDGTDNLAAQATAYANTMEACRAQPRCKAVTIWGISDKYSWIPAFFPGFGRALPFDASFQPKPAYYSLRDVLARP
jgi:endo-1,4-beta-xylanase